MKIAQKITLIILMILSTLCTTNCYADFISKDCADSENLIARDDPKVWDDRCQDLHMQKTFGSRWQEVKDFYFKFKKAVADNDKQKIGEMMHYPLRIDHNFVNKAKFTKLYDILFDKYHQKLVVENEYKDLYIFGNAVIIAYKFANPLTDSGISFTINCPNRMDNMKICYPYSIKIVAIDW